MKIYSQLLEFQKQVRVISKTSTAKIKTKNGNDYSYKFANLETIIETIKKPLEELGLGYYHSINGNTVSCILFNAEGDKLESSLELIIDKEAFMSPGQQQGTAITYARRYTLSSVLGLITEEDNDDNSNRPLAKQNSPQSQNQAPQEDKKKWFNLKTKDGVVLDKNYQYIVDNYSKGATASQIIKTLEKSGYTIHSSVVKEIEQMEAVDNYEDIVLVD
jgi:hypothetical protein